MVDDGDIALRYADRFGCIGPDCEDHCCHSWRVIIDARTYKKLSATVARDAVSKRKLKRVVRTEKAPGQQEPLRTFKMDANGNCPMLSDERLCRIQELLGPDYLSDVCATYPRRLQRIGEHWELTMSLSCPEAARQLLLHDDAIDIVPWDKRTFPRRIGGARVDPRDIRPYWRLLPEVRSVVLQILGDDRYDIAQRLFFVTYFAHRTNAVLTQSLVESDYVSVRQEMADLRREAVLDKLAQGFDAIETPSALVLLLARSLVKADVAGKRRPKLTQLVRGVFAQYDLAEGRLEREGDESADAAKTRVIYDRYRERRAAVMARAPERIERYLRNFVFHSWVHRLHLTAPDILTFTLRMWAQLALVKFLLFSHPAVAEALQGDDDDELARVLDAAAVEVIYTVARYVEHSKLIANLEKALEIKEMFSLAGAVYLIKF